MTSFGGVGQTRQGSSCPPQGGEEGMARPLVGLTVGDTSSLGLHGVLSGARSTCLTLQGSQSTLGS